MNKHIISGNLTADPEVRYTTGGEPNASFTVANNNRWTDKEGNKKESTDFLRCQIWGKRAETIGQYFKKGSFIECWGAVKTRSYDKDGQKHYITETRVEGFEFGPKIQGTGNPATSDSKPPETGSVDSQLPF